MTCQAIQLVTLIHVDIFDHTCIFSAFTVCTIHMFLVLSKLNVSLFVANTFIDKSMLGNAF